MNKVIWIIAVVLFVLYWIPYEQVTHKHPQNEIMFCEPQNIISVTPDPPRIEPQLPPRPIRPG